MSIVTSVICDTYQLDAVRQAVTAVLTPLGGIERFVRPGMKVLLKPNLLAAADPERAVTTHPAVTRAVAEMVQKAGGEVWIGDSPAGPVENGPQVCYKSGTTDVAAQAGARLIPFDGVTWKRLNGQDYFIARPIFEADLVINLPKLKTHIFTLYTGAVKNLFGAIPGTRKRQVHYQTPRIEDFSRMLADVLELVRPGLTILDGVVGQEGNGPGTGGTPHRYKCLAAATDPVALDTVVTHAMGYRPQEVLHLIEAGSRGLGTADLAAIQVEGERRALDFGAVHLPTPRWYFRVPAFMAAPMRRAAWTRPRLVVSACIGCGHCVEACPCQAITPGNPPHFDLESCIGCLCCCEVCPQGAIALQRNLLARLFGFGLSSFGL
jgi:uncharacterized protein (DUF362 family)/Pyruvate/2-oxoacid:ferredoxin oxidoreductase delta subunit